MYKQSLLLDSGDAYSLGLSFLIREINERNTNSDLCTFWALQRAVLAALTDLVKDSGLATPHRGQAMKSRHRSFVGIEVLLYLASFVAVFIICKS